MVAQRTIVQQWRISHVTILVRTDDIVEYTVDANAHVTLEDQMEITGSLIQRLDPKKKYAMIVDTGDFTTHSPESTRYAREIEDQVPVWAYAIITRNFGARLAANVYLRIFKPARPMLMFNSFPEAEAWSEKQLAGFRNQST